MRRLTDQLTTQGVFGDDPRPHHVDVETHWHPGHLGTGLSGRKHVVLTREQMAEIENATGKFATLFGYGSASERTARMDLSLL